MNKRTRKTIKRIMIILLSIIIILGVAIFLFMQQSKFGKAPSGDRLEKIKASAHYKDGTFENLSYTPTLTGDGSYAKALWEFLFVKKERLRPVDSIPSVKTDLLHLDINANVLVWFGHSSYFMQIDGKRILVDPVFSGAASPVSFAVKSFNGTDIYTTDDIPEIDYLFISHDHWDHLDYETVVKLKSKVKTVICGLGVGEHFEYWGYDKDIIVEKDWNESASLGDGFSVHFTPERHFSGRTLRRNISVWTSFVLRTPTMQVFIGGDSGYDTHFSEIGKTFGSFDLVILENGQYDEKWANIHMMPHEVLQAAKELNGKRLFPVHSSKFTLANHAWDEPLKKITELNEVTKQSMITPMIGEPVNLSDTAQTFSKWWVGLE